MKDKLFLIYYQVEDCKYIGVTELADSSIQYLLKVECNPYFEIDEDCTWENMMPDNVHVRDYPREEIKKKNKQLTFELGI